MWTFNPNEVLVIDLTLLSENRYILQNKVPVVHTKSIIGKTVWVIPAQGRGKYICETTFSIN